MKNSLKKTFYFDVLKQKNVFKTFVLKPAHIASDVSKTGVS